MLPEFARLCDCEKMVSGCVDSDELLSTLHAMYKRCDLTTAVATSEGKELPCHRYVKHVFVSRIRDICPCHIYVTYFTSDASVLELRNVYVRIRVRYTL